MKYVYISHVYRSFNDGFDDSNITLSLKAHKTKKKAADYVKDYISDNHIVESQIAIVKVELEEGKPCI